MASDTAGTAPSRASHRCPRCRSNPDYATDRAFQAVRLDVRTGRVDVLPLPLSDGIAAGVTFAAGKVDLRPLDENPGSGSAGATR